MAYQSPRHSQSFYQYDESTPPPPPPKPGGTSTPAATGPPLPPPPPQPYDNQPPHQQEDGPHNATRSDSTGTGIAIQPPEDGWLPDILRDKSYVRQPLPWTSSMKQAGGPGLKKQKPGAHRTKELDSILQTPHLQHALIHHPETSHPSVAASTAPLQTLLAQNIALATSLKKLETHVQLQRDSTQSRLLALRALERQWRDKQAEQDEVLRDFSPPALYQRLSAAVGEQEALCRGLEESFLEGEGAAGGGGDAVASEREVVEFVRRLREGRKIAYLRAERKERWDEGRVGGWR
ncbi:hypothetical protein ACEQ8H_001823 [Pleosporales sp. CAS-2024a]